MCRNIVGKIITSTYLYEQHNNKILIWAIRVGILYSNTSRFWGGRWDKSICMRAQFLGSFLFSPPVLCDKNMKKQNTISGISFYFHAYIII